MFPVPGTGDSRRTCFTISDLHTTVAASLQQWSSIKRERERERERERQTEATKLSVTPGHRTVQEGVIESHTKKGLGINQADRAGLDKALKGENSE